MDLLTIDYNILLYVTIGAFALSGFMRGWWREGLTTVLLLILIFFIREPDAVRIVIEFINNALEITGIVVGTGGNLSKEALQASIATAQPPTELDPSNRNLYIILLAVLILVAYFGSRRGLPSFNLGSEFYTPQPGARIVGAIIGAFNGFIIVNLFRDIFTGRNIPDTGVFAQSATPQTLSIAISEVPPNSAFSDSSFMLILGIGLVIVALTLMNRVKFGKREFITPQGYSVVKAAPSGDKK